MICRSASKPFAAAMDWSYEPAERGGAKSFFRPTVDFCRRLRSGKGRGKQCAIPTRRTCSWNCSMAMSSMVDKSLVRRAEKRRTESREFSRWLETIRDYCAGRKTGRSSGRAGPPPKRAPCRLHCLVLAEEEAPEQSGADLAGTLFALEHNNFRAALDC